MLGKILTRLFALFGMSLTCVACYGTPYMGYDPDFVVSGRVVDEEGQPIKDISAEMNVVTRTDADGVFYLQGDTPQITFRDTDGEANGGEFETRTINLTTSRDLGDITLERKK